MEIYDLTLPLRPGGPSYPGDPEVRFTRVRDHQTDGYQVTELCLGSHSGTHLDAPRHFFPAGATIDEYGVQRLVGPGMVVDCRPPRATADPSWTIDASHLAGRLRPRSLPRGGFALLWTEGALLTVAAARMLLKAGVSLVGTDSPSLDADPHPVHRLLLGQDILLAENLSGLAALGPEPLMCAFLPLAVAGADGAPVRAIAWR